MSVTSAPAEQPAVGANKHAISLCQLWNKQTNSISLFYTLQYREYVLSLISKYPFLKAYNY